MVQIRTGAGVTAFSGSIAGNVCSHNRTGAYMRAGTKPTNTRSSALCRSRSVLSLLTKKWSVALTPEQRLAWETYALGIVSHNALGESMHLTGQLMFIRTNQTRISAGLDICLSAPHILELGEKDPTASIWSVTPPLLSLSFDETQAWRTEDNSAIVVLVSRPQKHTTNFFNGPWRFAGAILGSTTTPPQSPCFVPFPFSITTGQRLFVKVCILRADGRTSNQFDLPPIDVTGTIPTTATINYSFIRQIGVWVLAVYFNQPMLNTVICNPIYWRLRKSDGTPVTIQNWIWVNPTYGDFKTQPPLVDPGLNCRFDYIGNDPGVHAVLDNSDCLPVNNVLCQHE